MGLGALCCCCVCNSIVGVGRGNGGRDRGEGERGGTESVREQGRKVGRGEGGRKEVRWEGMDRRREVGREMEGGREGGKGGRGGRVGRVEREGGKREGRNRWRRGRGM